MLHLEIVQCNPEMKVGVQVLWDKKTNAKVEMLDNYVSKNLECMESAMILITDKGETHDNLMTCAFDALLKVSKTNFRQNFLLESWNGKVEKLLHA